MIPLLSKTVTHKTENKSLVKIKKKRKKKRKNNSRFLNKPYKSIFFFQVMSEVGCKMKKLIAKVFLK